MAPATSLVSVEEYLATDYMPNAEYVDGVVTPKPMPTYLHNRVARELLFLILKYNPKLDPVQEQHVLIREGKYLIPDVAALRADEPQSPYATKPFPLCIEILSPDDRINQVLEKCRDYLRFGIQTVWIIDPVLRHAWIFQNDVMPTEVSSNGTLVAEGLAISLSELFQNIPSNL